MSIYRKIFLVLTLSILFSSPLFMTGNTQADDAYEPNDTLAEAWHPGSTWVRTWLSDISGLGVQADEDWYLIDVDMTSQRIQVDCRFIHADGDIDIGLYDSTGVQVPTPEGMGESVTDNELIDVAIGGGGIYYIKVFYWDELVGGTGNTYDLRWDDLTEDAYEENDTRSAAWYPGHNWERTWLSDIDGFGIQANDDWYRIDVDPGAERIQVDCQFTHAEGDIDIELYDSAGGFLTRSDSTTDNEFIDYTDSVSGTYYIRVYKSNAGNTYNLWWDDFSEDAYEENDTRGAAWHPGYNWERRWLSNIDGFGIQADDDWYRIDVDPGAERIQVDCQFTHAEGDIDIELYDSGGTRLAESSSTTDNEFIDREITSGGTYYIRVFFEDAGNAYDLLWDDFSSGTTPLVSDFGTVGLWQYDDAWSKLATSNPSLLGAYGNKLVAEFSSGLYEYDGSWTEITSNDCEDTVGIGSVLYVDFGSLGLWRYDGGWTKVAMSNPSLLGSYGNKLVAEFSSGLYEYGGSWTKIASADCEDVVSVVSDLYVDFGSLGLWRYDGGWTKVAMSNPSLLGSYGNKLVAEFSSGLYEYDGSWTKIASSDCEDVVGIISDLYVDFGSLGLWKYDGGWTKVASSNVEDMSALYAN